MAEWIYDKVIMKIKVTPVVSLGIFQYTCDLGSWGDAMTWKEFPIFLVFSECDFYDSI